jgi:hypothetical protein
MNKLISVIIFTAAFSSGVAHADTLATGAVFADSREDLRTFTSLAVDNDTEAMGQMAMEGKISLPTKKPLQIKIIRYSLLDPGVAGFRIRGDTTIYWAVTEDITSAVPYPTPN